MSEKIAKIRFVKEKGTALFLLLLHADKGNDFNMVVGTRVTANAKILSASVQQQLK